MIHDAVQSFAELDIRKAQKIQEDEKLSIKYIVTGKHHPIKEQIISHRSPNM